MFYDNLYQGTAIKTTITAAVFLVTISSSNMPSLNVSTSNIKEVITNTGRIPLICDASILKCNIIGNNVVYRLDGDDDLLKQYEGLIDEQQLKLLSEIMGVFEIPDGDEIVEDHNQLYRLA